MYLGMLTSSCGKPLWWRTIWIALFVHTIDLLDCQKVIAFIIQSGEKGENVYTLDKQYFIQKRLIHGITTLTIVPKKALLINRWYAKIIIKVYFKIIPTIRLVFGSLRTENSVNWESRMNSVGNIALKFHPIFRLATWFEPLSYDLLVQSM